MASRTVLLPAMSNKTLGCLAAFPPRHRSAPDGSSRFSRQILVPRRGQTDGLAFVGVVIDQKMPETESGFTRRAGDDDIAGVKRVPRDEVFQRNEVLMIMQQALHIVKLGVIAGLGRHKRIFAVKRGIEFRHGSCRGTMLADLVHFGQRQVDGG